MGDTPRISAPRPVTAPVRPPLAVPPERERERRHPHGHADHAPLEDRVELHDEPVEDAPAESAAPPPAPEPDGHIDVAA